MGIDTQTTLENLAVGGEKITWVFPDDLDEHGIEVTFESVEIRMTKSNKAWPVYTVVLSNGDKKFVSGWSLTSKEKFKANDLIGKKFGLTRKGTSIRMVPQ